jgi:trigger factor
VKVNVKNLSGCSVEIQVEVPAEIVQEKVDKIYERFLHESKVPGFRKGKAPLDVIKNKYKSLVREEITHNELKEFIRVALNEKKINPIIQPSVTQLDFEEGSPLKFTAMLEIKPEIQLKNYKGIKAKKEKTKVDEEEVDKVLNELREQRAQFIPVEDRKCNEEDLVVVDFEGKIEGKPFDGGKATRYPVFLGAKGLLKDFESNLIGMRKGETKTFKILFPKDYGKKEVAGQEAEFSVILHEIKQKKLPLVDNDFAKDVGSCETVKELREKLENQIKANKEAEQRAKMIEQIGMKLIAEHPLDIPVSLILLEQKRLVRQAVERLRTQGVDAAKLTDDQKKELVENLKPLAQNNVHMALLVEKITIVENIKCEEKDLDAYLEKISKGVNQSIDAVRKHLQEKGEIETTREWIQYEKTLDLLISQAKIEAA